MDPEEEEEKFSLILFQLCLVPGRTGSILLRLAFNPIISIWFHTSRFICHASPRSFDRSSPPPLSLSTSTFHPSLKAIPFFFCFSKFHFTKDLSLAKRCLFLGAVPVIEQVKVSLGGFLPTCSLPLREGPVWCWQGRSHLELGLSSLVALGFTWNGHPHLPEQGSGDLPQAPGM